MILFRWFTRACIAGMFLFSCNEEEFFTECEIIGISIKEKSVDIDYIFDIGGVKRLKEVTAYQGTDSSFQLLYNYEGGQLSKIEKVDTVRDVTIKYFDIQYSGTVLKGYREYIYNFTADNFDKGRELLYVYEQDNIVEIQYYYPNKAGDYFQVEELRFNYTTDSTFRIIRNIDVIARIAILIGNDPVGYNPVRFEETEIWHDHKVNPFYGIVMPEKNNQFFGLLKNNTIERRSVSRTNVIIPLETFEVSYNSFGNFISGESNKKVITAWYRNCL